MAFQLRAKAFEANATIPKKFTCGEADVSPALEWDDPPSGTKCFALIVDDPDAPAGTWVHWVLFNIPGDARELEEGVPQDPALSSGAVQGKNDFGKFGYNGPCPPRGRPHRYFFKLYALDHKLSLKAGAEKPELERAMKNRVLAKAEIVGKFQH
jgi:Raf kinase inhibitor-like YbhB/YbcL family protein